MDKIEYASDLLIKNLSKEHNILKVVEECAELQEVMIKYLTKGSVKPKLEKLVEEMGDVVFRIMVTAKMLDVENEVQGRVEEKAVIIVDWIEKKYLNKT